MKEIRQKILGGYEMPPYKEDIMEYYITENIGKAKYVVSFYNGKTHRDGSKFFDIKILKSRRLLTSFCNQLKAKGYEEK